MTLLSSQPASLEAAAASTPNPEKRMLEKRAKVIEELLQTERDYIRDLEMCVQKVQVPLQEAQVGVTCGWAGIDPWGAFSQPEYYQYAGKCCPVKGWDELGCFQVFLCAFMLVVVDYLVVFVYILAHHWVGVQQNASVFSDTVLCL